VGAYVSYGIYSGGVMPLLTLARSEGILAKVNRGITPPE
jgi:hypothetical protein